MTLARSYSKGVTITNPLVKYRALVATKRIEPDPAQHRLAIYLQKLYERLKDYEPIVQYGHKLSQISRALSSTPGQSPSANGSAHQPPKPPGLFSSLFEPKVPKESLALTRVLTSHEGALQIDSPRGLMLHGEVGTGKSMLIDLFAECLPNRKKKRRHFTTFMLETLAKLEQLRRSRQLIIPTALGQQDDYSLLWLAREMISTSPILFLDEFQLPDRTASKIMTNLMTGFFHLGGVLIATSNRMPEELAKAAGMEFAAPAPSKLESLRWSLGFRRQSARPDFTAQSDFAAFLDVLKARCDVWEIDSSKDYRRRETGVGSLSDQERNDAREEILDGFDGLENMFPGNLGLGYEQSLETESECAPKAEAPNMPRNFLVKPKSSEPGSRSDWQESYRLAEGQALRRDPKDSTPIPWTPNALQVYGRTVVVPRQRDGVSLWTFDELCKAAFGPADYITLASTFHTLILTDVPVLSILQKNEARRFITLLDALYEARCKLLITADAGPDELFFPERSPGRRATDASTTETQDEDATYAETFSEVYQDATSPFRPNVSMYEGGSSHSSEAPLEPDYTHARLQGILSDHQLENQPPNRPQHARRGDNIHGLDQSPAESPVALSRPDPLRGPGTAGGPDFRRAGIYTGEDEKFAYKRARSRLWEMCGAPWWARGGEGWWTPVDASVRPWERSLADPAPEPSWRPRDAQRAPAATQGSESAPVEEGMGSARAVSEEQDAVMFPHGGSPFRTSPEPPPKFPFQHFWGTVRWGKRAGAWGKGVEGLEDRHKEKAKDKNMERDVEEGKRS